MRWRRRFTFGFGPAAAAVVALLGVGATPALTACGAPPAQSAEANRGSDVRAVPPNAVTQVLSTTPIGTPLYTRLTSSSAAGDTSQALTATLEGITYRSATGLWVGCEGTAATTVYRLAGEFTKLSGVLGVQPHTPSDLQVKFQFIVDGDTRHSATLRRDRPTQKIAIPLAGARSITITALAVTGECAPAPAPYGAIGSASLT